MVFFFSQKHPFFIFARAGSGSPRQWQTFDYTNYLTVFYDAVATSSGNVYAIGSNGVFCEIVFNRPLRLVEIWQLGVLRKSLLYNKQQLVIYGPGDDDDAVFVVQRRSLLDLEVWKMRFPAEEEEEGEILWERVWDLGDLAIFSSRMYSKAFSGLEWGIQGNRVYFIDDDDDDDVDAAAAANNNNLCVLPQR